MTGPLSSLKVLDFTMLLPGPFATMTLADLGADVVRIESPSRTDMVRTIPPFDGDSSTWHALLNRNKRSLHLDLKRPEAIDIVKRLVSPEAGYDVVVEQFRPGVMDRLGIGYEALREANPALVYCAITGYGQTGPLRDRAGHDINYIALSGLLSYSGSRQSGPALLGTQVADIGGGSFGALVGLLTAVVHRQATGSGQSVDISMFDMMLAWQAHTLSNYLAGEDVPDKEAMPLNGGLPYGYYQTSDGRYLSVGSLEPKFWAGFCEAIGRAELVEPGLSPSPETQARVKAEISGEIAARSLAEWTAVFGELDVCVEPVLTVPEALAQAQVSARGLVAHVPRPGAAPQQQIASPYRFSETAASYRHIGPVAGEHTDQVLAEVGYKVDEMTRLRAAGVFG